AAHCRKAYSRCDESCAFLNSSLSVLNDPLSIASRSSAARLTQENHMDRSDLNQRLPTVVNQLVASALAEPSMQHLNRVLRRSRDAVIECIKDLRQLIFPGYFGKPGLTRENIGQRIGE